LQYDVVAPSQAATVAVLIVAAEILIAVSHVSGQYVDSVALVALGLLAVFLLAVTRAICRGQRARCLCFGAQGEFVSVRSVVRIVLLLIAEFVIWISATSGPRPSSEDGADLKEAMVLATTSISCLIALHWILSAPQFYSLYKFERPTRGRCSQRNRIEDLARRE
jgi:hypothetical protein